MTLYQIVPATEVHARAVAARMREHDAIECEALGYTPEQGAVTSLQNSVEAWAGLADGVPVCVFGLVTRCLAGDEAEPWLLSTDELVSHGRAFVRRNRSVIQNWRGRYSLLSGLVYEKNVISQRWLRWLGFHLTIETTPIGPKGLLFHRFDIGDF